MGNDTRTKRSVDWKLGVIVAGAMFLFTPVRSRAQNTQMQLPDGEGKRTVQQLCTSCHGIDRIESARMNAAGWEQVVNDMVSRGATGTPDQLQTVISYLSTYFSATSNPGRGRGGFAGMRGGGRGIGGGQDDITALSAFDMSAVDRGQRVFAAQCASCHGLDARGGKGLTQVDLILSPMVLDDVGGNDLGPFLKVGRPDKNMPKFDLEAAQLTDLVTWLHYTISKDTLRGYYVRPNVFSGDANAGKAFFDGPVGKCYTCHSENDMKAVAAKDNHDNPSILSAIVTGGGGRGRGGFPGRGGPGGPPPEVTPPSPTAVTATVTLASGEKIVGYPQTVDDFVIEIRLPSGQTRTWLRNGEWPKVTLTNPLQAHVDLVLKYTDADLHNLAAYIESLK